MSEMRPQSAFAGDSAHWRRPNGENASTAWRVHFASAPIALLLHIVAKQIVLIAQIELAAGDDRMRPAFPVVYGQLELPIELIALGRSFDQGHRAILIAEVELPVGVGHGGRFLAGSAIGSPHGFAGL